MRPLGATGLQLPALGFGGAPLGEPFVKIPEAQAQAALQAAWDLGVRYFDTAPWYGHGLSEHRIGHFLRQQEPRSWWCSTKVGRVYSRFRGDIEAAVTSAPWAQGSDSASATAPWAGGLPFTPRFDYSYDGIMRSYEDSLHRLGQNRVQSLVIHDLDFQYHNSEAEVAERLEQLTDGWRALMELKDSGEIRAIGAGINQRGMMTRFLKDFSIDFFLVAMPYTLLDQEVLDDEFPACEARGVGVVVGSPFASEILAVGARPGVKYDYVPAQPDMLQRVARIEEVCQSHRVPLKAVALQFPLGHPIVTSVIPGVVSVNQVQENVALLEVNIPDACWRDLKSEGLIREDAPVSATSTLTPNVPQQTSPRQSEPL